MNRIIFTETDDAFSGCAFIDERAEYCVHETASEVGTICVGRVEHIVKNLRAAFVRFGGDRVGYLPFSEIPDVSFDPRSDESPRVQARTAAEGQSARLSAGMLLPVQVTRDARGEKQPKLTAYLSLSGEYVVLTYGKSGVGCSKKLAPDARRELLRRGKEALRRRTEEGGAFSYGVILRTEAAGVVEAKIAEEISALEAKLRALLQDGRDGAAGSVLYRPVDSVRFEERLLQLYHFCEKFRPQETEVLLGEATAERLLAAAAGTKRTLDAGGSPPARQQQQRLAEAFRAKSPFLSAHTEIALRITARGAEETAALYGWERIRAESRQKKVWMKSGGYLVIERTEAMHVIDVNSGKSVRESGDLAEQINLEAADECMRQIRLRGLTGIIVIDFINMRGEGAARRLTERLSALCACDPVHTAFVDLTGLGLAELTRRG